MKINCGHFIVYMFLLFICLQEDEEDFEEEIMRLDKKEDNEPVDDNRQSEYPSSTEDVETMEKVGLVLLVWVCVLRHIAVDVAGQGLCFKAYCSGCCWSGSVFWYMFLQWMLFWDTSLQWV